MLQFDEGEVGGEAMRMYSPLLLLSLTGIAMFNPCKVQHYQYRRELVFSLVRSVPMSVPVVRY